MSWNLLVPLDGSEMAEAALGAALCMARLTGGRIMLLHVIERDAPHHVHQERHLREAGEAEDYLREVSERGVMAGVVVERHVHTGETADIAAGIVEHISELHPDVIVMSTHGRANPSRWVFGSVAQQVVSKGSAPVLLIPPKHRMGELFSGKRRLLVPLDGESQHEESVGWAVELARACGARIQLLTVVHTVRSLRGERAAAAAMLPGTMAAVLEIEQQNAEEYLKGVARGIRELGVEAEGEVRRGKRVATILDVAVEVDADAIVLSTHRKAGSEAFWSASVGPRAAMESELPVLLVPIG